MSILILTKLNVTDHVHCNLLPVNVTPAHESNIMWTRCRVCSGFTEDFTTSLCDLVGTIRHPVGGTDVEEVTDKSENFCPGWCVFMGTECDEYRKESPH